MHPVTSNNGGSLNQPGGHNIREEGLSGGTAPVFLPHWGDLYDPLKNCLFRPF